MKDDTIGNQQATEVELGWLAGIFDGEGYIGLSYENRKKSRCVRPNLQLVNCDPDVILKTRNILIKIGINPHIRERVHDRQKWSRNYILSMDRFASIKKFIDTVGHLLTGEKKKRAELMIALINSRITKTKKDQYDEYELSLVKRYFDTMKGVKIRGNTDKIRSLNDYTPDSRHNVLEMI